MIYKLLFFVYFIACTEASRNADKKCPNCSVIRCSSSEALGCPDNFVTDECGCCPICLPKCLDCKLVKFKCPEPDSLNCKHGFEADQCSCCYRCLKGAGEKCGGPRNVYGNCKQGLSCVRPKGSRNSERYCQI